MVRGTWRCRGRLCALMLSALFGCVCGVNAAPAGQGTSGSRAAAARTSATELDRLLAECIGNGDSRALLRATRIADFATISAELKALPTAVKPLLTGEVHRRADRLPAPAASVCFDKSGALHVVCVVTERIDEPDNLGNPNRMRSRALYLVKRDRWSEPHVLADNLLSISGARIVVGKGWAVDILLWGDNTRPTQNEMGVAPGAYDVLIVSRQADGVWRAPLSLSAERPKLMHGMDCLSTAPKTLHVAWSSWRDGVSSIRYRRRVAGHWEEERTLAGIPNRNLMKPVLRALDGDLNLFVVGQTRDYRRISFWELVHAGDRWGEPSMLLDETDLEVHASLNQKPFAVCALKCPKNTPGKYVVFRPGSDGPAKPIGEMPLPDSGLTLVPNYGWSYPAVAMGPDAVPYLVMGESANLYLLRPGDGGTEAVCLHLGSDGQGAQAQFAWFRERRLHLMWTLYEKGRAESRLSACAVPEDGWEDVEAVLWKTRAGRGLTRRDSLFLGPRAFVEARALEARPDVAGAVEWYLHIAVGFKSAQNDALGRLLELHRAGRVEVMQKVLAYAREHPESRKRKHPVGYLMRVMGLAEPAEIKEPEDARAPSGKPDAGWNPPNVTRDVALTGEYLERHGFAKKEGTESYSRAMKIGDLKPVLGLAANLPAPYALRISRSCARTTDSMYKAHRSVSDRRPATPKIGSLSPRHVAGSVE